MTVSIKRMSAGEGYRYLMQSVVVGDGHRAAAMPLTRYYTEAGTPPGRWLGAGLDGLAAGGPASGSLVTEEQLFRLLGLAADPGTGDPLGAAPQAAAPGLRERIHRRLAALPSGLPGPVRQQRIEAARREELAREPRKAVTGFDLTFSVPKSVSALWALADADMQERIAAAHHAAIGDALAWAERNVFATRVGKGGAVRMPVLGVIAAGFDHFESRAGDPHLHTHVVVANRVQTEPGGKWRTLDSRALFRATVALSELHQGLLMDRLSSVLGVGWDARLRRHSAVPQWEITGVPDTLRAEFSQRANQIERAKDELVAAYRAAHGRHPDLDTVLKLRQQATLVTRPDKQQHSLADLTADWRRRAARHIGDDSAAWARALPRLGARPLRADGVPAGDVQRFAEQTLAAVADKRATFTRWNVYAEAQRQLQALRFATPADREVVGDRVTDSAIGLAVLLAPSEDTLVPVDVAASADRPLRHASGEKYTTRALWDAEERLLTASRDTTAPSLSGDATVGALRHAPRPLSVEQQAVIADIATSGRRVDLLVGAAGTGKTTALAGLVSAWHESYGPGSVLGLAPSATAADVLGRELQLPTENTAKWLTETGRQTKRIERLDQLRGMLNRLPAGSPQHQRVVTAARALARDLHAWQLQAGQLVIVDEASLAGTAALDAITGQAGAAGAKVLLVGDHAQLSAINAGGAFGMLVRDRGDAPELVDIRRFNNPWEKHASLALRAGVTSAIDTYALHGRIHDGNHDSALNQAYAAWLADQQAGKQTLLIAADSDTVTSLNARAHDDLVATGLVAAGGVQLADGTTASLGDRIITRRNDRSLTSGQAWVKNGDTWSVREIRPDGTMSVRRPDDSTTVVLPPDYVREHVELGYANTAHRAQGQTVDTAHVVITGPTMTREALYVATTRARDANHLYIAADDHTDVESSYGTGEHPTARDLLAAIITHAGAELSAHETARTPKTHAAEDSRAHASQNRPSPPAPSAPRPRQPTDPTITHDPTDPARSPSL